MTAPILRHPSFNASLVQKHMIPAQPVYGPLARLTGWLHDKTMAFENLQACRRTARIVRSLPNDVQKDIGWRAHCNLPSERTDAPSFVASLAPRVFFNQN
ncbi:MAG: hypothetical protein AAF737_03855 [Pseudomonadota bacterium]